MESLLKANLDALVDSFNMDSSETQATGENASNVETPQNNLKKSKVKGSSDTPKRVRSTIVSDECEVLVPEGWTRQVVQRQGGLSAGKYDVYYYSPLGKKLRSRKEVETYCQQNNLPVNLEMFRFTRVSISNQKVKQRSLSSSPKTPKLPKPKIDKSQKSPKTPKLPKQKKLATESAGKKSNSKLEKHSPMKISSESLMKKRKKVVWVPPKSPFHLFQENLFQNPWKLLVGTLIMNRLPGEDGTRSSILQEFFKKWSSADSTKAADWREIAEFLKAVPNADKIAKMIVKLSEEYLMKQWTYPKELHGVGKYGNDSYRIFCVNEWKKVKPTDYLLTFYVDWLWDNHAVLGID